MSTIATLTTTAATAATAATVGIAASGSRPDDGSTGLL